MRPGRWCWRACGCRGGGRRWPRGRTSTPRCTVSPGAHFVSDAYSNLYAPLLPGADSRLGLSLAPAGTLAMLFQLSASVSQLGFGHVADGGASVTDGRRPLRVGCAPEPHRCRVVAGCAGRRSGGRRAWRRRVPPGGSRARSPAGRATARIGHVDPHYRRFDWVFARAGAVRTVCRYVRALLDTASGASGLVILAAILAGAPAVSPFGAGPGGGFSDLRPYAKPLTLLYLIVVLRTMTSLSLATFVPVLLTRQGWSVAHGWCRCVDLSLRGKHGRIHRRAPGGSVRLEARHCRVDAPRDALLVAATRTEGWPLVILLAAGGFFLQSTLPVNVTFRPPVAPVSAATVSSLMMGFAWGTGASRPDRRIDG